MVRPTWVLGLALLSVAAADAADAQNPEIREGFFVGFGLGAGSLGVENGDGRETGWAAHLAAGRALSPRLLLAAEAAGWTKELEGAGVLHANVGAIAQLYPMAEGDLFLRAGIGGSILHVSRDAGGIAYRADDTGLGATAGLGYDVRVGPNVSITPYALFVWGSFDGGSASHVQGGLGATFH